MCFKREKCLRVMIHYYRLAWFHFPPSGEGQSTRRKQPMADKEILLFDLRRNTRNLRFRNSFSKSSHKSLEVPQKCQRNVLIYTAQNWSNWSELDSEMCCSNLSIFSIYTEKTSYSTLENCNLKMDPRFGFSDLELVYVRPLCCHRATLKFH